MNGRKRKKICRSNYFNKKSDENYKKSYHRNVFLQLPLMGWILP